MAMNERPGVYSTYEVTNSVRGAAQGGVVGIAASSEMCLGEGAIRISTRAAALEKFGFCALTELCSLALRNGASAVYAVSVSGTAQYASAFETLCRIEDIGTMLCDSRDAAVHVTMAESILGASESYRYRIGVVEAAGAVSELTAAAKAINCERIVLCAADTDADKGYAAAALAGAIAATTDPALPLNGAELLGISPALKYSDDEVNELVRSGVSVLEQSGGSAMVLRAVTTRSMTGGVSDITWRELTTVRIIDHVIPGIRDALRRRFTRAKNTEQTRGAIRTQVVIELEDRKSREIIDDYGDVTAEASESDPTVCEVAFGFTVAHGLNHIQLTAKITV